MLLITWYTTEPSHKIWALSRENLSMGFSIRSYQNQSAQLLRVANEKIEILLVACLENDTFQLVNNKV